MSAPTTSYFPGSLVTISAVFTRISNGQDVDPDAVQAMVRKPNGAITTYTYGTDVALRKDSVGHYSIDLDLDQSGTWRYRFEGTGGSQSGADQAFYVWTSVFP